ncbi:hypothetical protein PQR15_33175 [Streptomyces lydicus]|nr:hypothetical protein [Streptomyces lydicus]
MLAAAAERLGRPCRRSERVGRVEREVVAAAADAELLVLARDGDRARVGPHSLGPAGRFVVDHAPARSSSSGRTPLPVRVPCRPAARPGRLTAPTATGPAAAVGRSGRWRRRTRPVRVG